MQEHVDPEVAKRCRRIAYISSVAFPVLIYFGITAEAPTSVLHWVGRVALVLATLYAEPAIFLTMRLIFRMPSALAFCIAMAPVLLTAWFWIVRWFF